MANDMNSVIQPKSDQINSDDLIAGDLTIRITEVSVSPGQEQPVSMKFDGSTKVYRPCKSMARVMVAAWGPDSSAYVGRSLQLYRDPTVKWGGMDVGGIRIRKMTNIDRPMTMALTATKGQRKPYVVEPLKLDAPANTFTPNQEIRAKARREAHKGTEHFKAWFKANPDKRPDAQAIMPDLKALCDAADEAIAKDPFGLPPLEPEPEIDAQIRAELAARDAEYEGGAQ